MVEITFSKSINKYFSTFLDVFFNKPPSTLTFQVKGFFFRRGGGESGKHNTPLLHLYKTKNNQIGIGFRLEKFERRRQRQKLRIVWGILVSCISNYFNEANFEQDGYVSVLRVNFGRFILVEFSQDSLQIVKCIETMINNR